MTELEMRELEAPWPKTWDELKTYVDNLTQNESDDYGKAVYCISLASVAMFNFVASAVGASGFQASCADMDFLRRTRYMKNGFQIINYDHLLYPQYLEGEDHTVNRIVFGQLKHNKHFKAAAQKLIDKAAAEKGHVHSNVLDHWKAIVEA